MLISVALRRRLYKTSRRNQSKSLVIVPSNGKNTNSSVAVYNYPSVRKPIYRLPRINTVHLRFTLKYYPLHNHEPTKGKRKT